MINRINYAIFYTFALFIILLPSFVRKALFSSIAYVVYIIDAKHRHIINANLTMAFGESFPQTRRKEITKSCFKNLFFEILSVIETHFLSTEKIEKRLHFVGLENVQKAHDEGKQIVYFTAHYNDLEIAGIAMGLVSKTVHTVQEASNPYIHTFISKGREKAGMKMVTMQRAIRAQAKQLKAGGDVSVVVDQAILGADVEFFGHKTKHTISTARLVRNYDAVLMPAVLLKDEKGRWQPTFYPPIPFTKSDDEEADLHYLVQAQATFTENLIKSNPDPWFWCHRRWKDFYPDIYKRR